MVLEATGYKRAGLTLNYTYKRDIIKNTICKIRISTRTEKTPQAEINDSIFVLRYYIFTIRHCSLTFD